MSTTFFAITGSDTLTGDMTLGLEDYELNVSSATARAVEQAIRFQGTEAGDVVAGELPTAEFLARVTEARGGQHVGETARALEMVWYLADEAARKGADFIAWG